MEYIFLKFPIEQMMQRLGSSFSEMEKKSL